jgi:mRNA interferase HigB
LRIVKESTLLNYCKRDRYKRAEQAIRSWIYEVRFSDWNNAAELRAKYKNASIISSKRVVFNIRGNSFRLVTDIEYQLKIVYVVWFGTHNEYEKIDVKDLNYDSKSNKK